MPAPPPVPDSTGKMVERKLAYHGPVMDKADMDEVIKVLGDKLAVWKKCGADMVTLRVEKYVHPLCNLRTDEYGGSMENRARFPLELAAGLKKRLGDNFIIEFVIFTGASQRYMTKGMPISDCVEFAKLCEDSGVVDVLTLRCFSSENVSIGSPRNVYENTVLAAQAMRQAGIRNMKLCLNGGFRDPDVIEAVLADGTADLVSVGRQFVADYEFGKKIKEGRKEDIVPCVLCNKCHMYDDKGPSIHYCTVNPASGMQHKLARMISPVERVKRVAVIGGGPGGMTAALECAKRGHQVTLFEQAPALGGQLRYMDALDFKYTYTDYKNYLIRQVEKSAIEVRLGVRAQPEDIAKHGYDVVIAAIGARPARPNVKGADDERIITACQAILHPESVGQRAVIVGGSETGTECGIYLAQLGRDVTVLSRQKKLCSEANLIHSIQDTLMDYKLGGYEVNSPAWTEYPNFSAILEAVTVEVAPDCVVYQAKNGEQVTLKADTVILSGGMEALTDDALAYHDAANEFYMIGDCRKVKDVAMAVRGAFNAASQI
jgi:thioredoxin reductase